MWLLSFSKVDKLVKLQMCLAQYKGECVCDGRMLCSNPRPLFSPVILGLIAGVLALKTSELHEINRDTSFTNINDIGEFYFNHVHTNTQRETHTYTYVHMYIHRTCCCYYCTYVCNPFSRLLPLGYFFPSPLFPLMSFFLHISYTSLLLFILLLLPSSL